MSVNNIIKKYPSSSISNGDSWQFSPVFFVLDGVVPFADFLLHLFDVLLQLFDSFQIPIIFQFQLANVFVSIFNFLRDIRELFSGVTTQCALPGLFYLSVPSPSSRHTGISQSQSVIPDESWFGFEPKIGVPFSFQDGFVLPLEIKNLLIAVFFDLTIRLLKFFYLGRDIR